jgi:hypothetical protein
MIRVSKTDNMNLSSRKSFLIIVVLMTIILGDTFLIKFYDTLDKDVMTIDIKKIIYSIIAFLCIVFEIIVLRYLKNLNSKTRVDTRIRINLINRIVQVSYYLLIALFAYLVFQMFYYNYYDSLVLMLIIITTYGIASLLIGKTMISFISWYRLNRNPTLLLYSISMSMILLNLILTPTIVIMILSEKPEQIRLFSGGSMDISGGKYTFLSNLVKISSILSFASIWFTTALLMHSAKDRFVKEVRYWIILCTPLLYFLFSYFAQDLFGTVLFPFFRSDPITFSLVLSTIFILSKPIGGIIFGLLYWRISRLVSFDKILREYMIISGYGFLLLFSANQSTLLVLGPYPPFGSITISVLILATYLILIGIYTSATLVSTNTELRKFIYGIAADSKFLNLLGKAEVEREINKTVSRVQKYVSTSESFEDINFEIDENDLKKYLENVIGELKNKKNK